MNTNEAVLALLERIALAVEALANRSAVDFRILALLRAISAAVGDSPFTAAHVVALSRDALSTRIALRHAVAGRSAESIGKQLAAHVELHPGMNIGGLTLERIGRSRPAQYRIRRSDDDRRNRPRVHAWPTV